MTAMNNTQFIIMWILLWKIMMIWKWLPFLCSKLFSNVQLWPNFFSYCILGLRTGLAARMRENFPEIIIIHCLAHRLELAFRDVIKKSTSKLYDKLLTLLLGLYYTYHKAPKQKKQLGDTFQLLGIGSVTPTRVGGTRWLPHMNRALKALIKGYRAFRMQLEESSNHNNPKAEGMAKIIADKNVIVYMLTLQEVISPLVRLSQYLQKRETTLAAGMERVLATQDMLRNLKLKWVFYVVVVTHAI